MELMKCPHLDLTHTWFWWLCGYSNISLDFETKRRRKGGRIDSQLLLTNDSTQQMTHMGMVSYVQSRLQDTLSGHYRSSRESIHWLASDITEVKKGKSGLGFPHLHTIPDQPQSQRRGSQGWTYMPPCCARSPNQVLLSLILIPVAGPPMSYKAKMIRDPQVRKTSTVFITTIL